MTLVTSSQISRQKVNQQFSQHLSCHVSVTEKKLILYMFLCVCVQTEEKEDEEEEALVGEVKASPNADTTILFVKGEGNSALWDASALVYFIYLFMQHCFELTFLFLSRLPRQQHRQVPARLHQQGLRELRGGVSGRLLPLPTGTKTHFSVLAEQL